MTGVRLPPALFRPGIRQLGRILDPGLAWEVQRKRLDAAMKATPVPRGTIVTTALLNGVPAEVVTARRSGLDGAGAARPCRTVLHFHGGGYGVGSPRMARAWAAHLRPRT